MPGPLQNQDPKKGGPPQLEEHFQPSREDSNACEYCIVCLCWVLIILTVPFSLCVCFRSIQEYQRAVVLRLGRLKERKAQGPGLVFFIPCTDEFYVVDLRVSSFDIAPQEVLTKDSVSIQVDAVIYYRVVAPVTAVCNVTDYRNSSLLLALTALRTVLGQFRLSEILEHREQIADRVENHIGPTASDWGVYVENVEIKDVQLPKDMQRAMAAEAEAQREANAKVIAAQGEKDASVALQQAAKNMESSPGALQLRYLQTLNVVAAENNSTIVFPIPLDFLQFVRNRGR